MVNRDISYVEMDIVAKGEDLITAFEMYNDTVLLLRSA